MCYGVVTMVHYILRITMALSKDQNIEDTVQEENSIQGLYGKSSAIVNITRTVCVIMM